MRRRSFSILAAGVALSAAFTAAPLVLPIFADCFFARAFLRSLSSGMEFFAGICYTMYKDSIRAKECIP